MQQRETRPDSRELVRLDGFHAVKHALRFGAVIDRIVAVDRDEALALARQLAPDVAEALAERVEAVEPSELEHVPYSGVVAWARRPRATSNDVGRNAPSVWLEDPRDLGNLGACIRVAAAAEAAGAFVSGDRDPWAPPAVRGSAGLHFAIPVVHGPPDLEARTLVAVAVDGDRLDPAAVPDNAVLAFGTERHGLSEAVREQASLTLALPMLVGVSSLNLATAVSAVLFAWRLRRAYQTSPAPETARA